MPVIKRKSDYYVEWLYGGRRFRERIGKSRSMARKVLKKIKYELAESKRNASL